MLEFCHYKVLVVILAFCPHTHTYTHIHIITYFQNHNLCVCKYMWVYEHNCVEARGHFDYNLIVSHWPGDDHLGLTDELVSPKDSSVSAFTEVVLLDSAPKSNILI